MSIYLRGGAGGVGGAGEERMRILPGETSGAGTGYARAEPDTAKPVHGEPRGARSPGQGTRGRSDLSDGGEAAIPLKAGEDRTYRIEIVIPEQTDIPSSSIGE